MRTSRISRRGFIYLGGVGIVAAGYPLARSLSQSGAAVAGRKFQPTPSNTLGPFYKEGAPVRERLIEPNEAGGPLLVAGRVFEHRRRAAPQRSRRSLPLGRRRELRQ